MLHQRQQRFEKTKRRLYNATEENRGKKGLNGPKNNTALKKYTETVQDILRTLKGIEITKLSDLVQGKITEKQDMENLMDIYYEIMMEITIQRQRAMLQRKQETPGETIAGMETKKVLFLYVNYIRAFFKCIDMQKNEALEPELRQMMNEDVIMMLYFPKELELDTPKPGSVKGSRSSFVSTPEDYLED